MPLYAYHCDRCDTKFEFWRGFDDPPVTVWLSGGTAGVNYKVACLITTSAGRTDERTIWIKVTNR